MVKIYLVGCLFLIRDFVDVSMERCIVDKRIRKYIHVPSKFEQSFSVRKHVRVKSSHFFCILSNRQSNKCTLLGCC